MVPNPFVALGQDPVAVLALAGYAIALLVVVLLGVAFTVRKGAVLLAYATDRGRRKREWWGEAFDGWLPPAWWIGWSAVVLLTWTVIFWALGAVVWVLQ